MAHFPDNAASKHASLGLWDVVSIMIGIVVGAGIYETPPIVLQNVAGPWQALAAWVLGGVMSLVGAFCYAELAAAYPRSGGDYVYLTRAFGPWLGFLFAWFQLSVIRSANIAMMAFVFADYAASIKEIEREWRWLPAFAAVLILTVLNLLGVIFGKRTQNVLTLAKVIGLACVLVVGFSAGWRVESGGWREQSALHPPPSTLHPSLATAMVLVLLTYGGWNDAAFVAAEVRGGPRAIARALLLGTAAITLLYLLLNAAFLWGLGFDRARQSSAIAADLLKHRLGDWGGQAIAVLVMVSALGAINGMMFSGARVYASLGVDHPIFALLGRVHGRTRAPWGALLVQSGISLGLIGVVGTPAGRALVNDSLTATGLPAVEWKGHGGFEVLSVVTTPLFWLFFLFSGLSVFVLRQRDPHLPRPFTVPLYPELPLLFCGICAYMIFAGIDYARSLKLLGGLFALAAALALVGLLLYRLSQRRKRAGSASDG
ncbi:MAG TPA: amino acid permease [Gemmataceae bacterium]|nr:amino acid permease [Gemmataceae bacterium]